MSALLAKDVRDQACGRWIFILDDLAPELKKATEKPGQKHIGCPVHKGKDGFRLFRDAGVSGGGVCNTCGPKPDGFALLMWLKDWNFSEALTAVAESLGMSAESHGKPVVTKAPVIVPPESIPDDKRTKAILRKIWLQSKSLHHPDAEPARRYLRNRGLDDSIPDWPSVRFHPCLQYWDEDRNPCGYYPAILSLIEKDDGGVTIHRTYLTADGRKAPVDSPKKMMAVPADKVLMGGAVRLGKPGRILSVTEGLEKTLAVIEATGMVTWSLVNSALMAGFEIPIGVEKLIIWSDKDIPSIKTGICPGAEAAAKLAERAIAQGVEVEIREPKGEIPVNAKSLDWLDVLNTQGPNAFALRSCS
jgi:putative DNA primase/helicase